MRSISATLSTAQTALNRHPISRITIRDTRLRFAAYTTGTNPWGYQDDEQVSSQDYVFGDSIALDSGTILRAWNADGNLMVQRIDAPGTTSEWSHATNAWTDLGIAVTDWTNPGFYADESDIYLFYMRSSTLRYRTSTDDGVNWSLETSTGVSFAGAVTVAPVSPSLVFMSMVTTGQLRVYAAIGGGSWTTSEMPWRVNGNSDFTLGSTEYQTITQFDAFHLANKDWVVYSLAPAGLAWISNYHNGVWGEPRLLIPDDYTAFHPYRAAVIQDRVWLTGRFERDNESEYSPAFDAYLYSDDGENWTALARDSYIGNNALRGKLLLSNGYVYYPGLVTTLRAPASYLIDPANDWTSLGGELKKTTITEDILGIGIQYPAAGSAPSADVSLATNDDRYLTTPYTQVIKPGSEITIEAGYKTTAGDEYVTLFQGGIDATPSTIADGTREISLSARDIGFKRLRDYVSPFYWEFLSQRKHFDDCVLIDKFSIESGTWEFEGRNLIANSTFETNTTGWADIADGTAAGSRTRTSDDKNTGQYAYQINKTAGAAGDNYGTSTTFSAETGKTYRIDANIRVNYIVGGELKTTLIVSGNYGAGGTAASSEVSWTDVTDFWETLSVEITTEAAATITVSLYLDSCTAGNVFIDDITAIDTAPSYFSFADQTEQGILLSVTGEQDHFDIRARFQDVATTSATTAGMGILGLAKDEFNFVLLQLARYSSGTFLQLYKRRAGTWTQLQSVSYTWSANTEYDLRLIHRGGRFLGYAKAASSGNFGAALIDYTWNSSTDVPCPTPNGKGRVGVRTTIRPRQFHAFGIDDHSKQILLRISNDLDWDTFTDSGTIMVDEEVMTYTGRTQYVDSSNRGPVLVAGNIGTAFQSRTCDAALHGASCPSASDQNQIRAIFGWSHYINSNLVAADDAYNEYGLVYTRGTHPYGTWLISDSATYAANYRLTTNATNSGHLNVHPDAGGDPIPHTGGLGSGDWGVYVAPCLFGLTRGASGTDAVAHADGALVYQHADDVIRLSSFELYDFEPDWNNERLLQRLCALTGQLDTEFDSTFSGGPYSLSGTIFTTGEQWLGGVNLKDLDLSFDWNHSLWLAGACSVGVILRASTIDTTTANGYLISLNYDGSVVALTLSQLSGGVTLTIDSRQLPSGSYPTSTTDNNFRVVAVGDFISVYCNGQLIGTFHDTRYSEQTNNFVAVIGTGSTATLSNVRVPQLSEWREFNQVDDGTGLQGAISKVVQDRPISVISRSGNSLKFSHFDTRGDLGTLTDQVYSDSYQPEDGEIFTFIRVVSEDILEEIDEDLAREYGFIHRQVQMPEATTPNAGAQITRLYRRMQEILGSRSENLTGLLTVENEDNVVVNLVASGTGYTLTNVSLIVNDFRYTLAPAEFSMSIGTRGDAS